MQRIEKRKSQERICSAFEIDDKYQEESLKIKSEQHYTGIE